MTNLWRPHPKQELALRQTAKEILYGGARGGGKSAAGMAWLLYPIVEPKYRGLVIRKHSEDLKDWIDRARSMYSGTGAVFTGQPVVIEFPSGAKIHTGHLKDENAYEKYQGQEYQRILIEELTQIPSEDRYEKLIMSCRSTVPGLEARIFATTNPGGPGTTWVKKRFVDITTPGKKYISDTGLTRIFIQATVDDNPTLLENDPDYVKMLDNLAGALKKAWRYGDWNIDDVQGAYYQEELSKARQEFRITKLPIDPWLPVHTAWDLGRGDDTAIVFFQIKGQEVRQIHSYSNHGKTPPYYFEYIKEWTNARGLTRGKYLVPHDGKKSDYNSGKNMVDIAREYGIHLDVVPRTQSVINAITECRIMFSRLWFDEDECKPLLEALRNYRKEYDDKLGTYKENPLHDWSSHYCDAFRTMCQGINIYLQNKVKKEVRQAPRNQLVGAAR